MTTKSSKDKLLKAAKRLFSERGYSAVSVRDILKEVDGSSGMFYHHFKSKDDIYQQTMCEYFDETIIDKRALIRSKSLTFEEKLKSLNVLMRKNYLGFIETFKPSKEEGSGNTAYMTVLFYKMLSQLSLDVADMLDEAIEKGEYIKRGTIANIDNQIIADALLFALLGVLYSNFGLHKKEERLDNLLPVACHILGIEMEEGENVDY